MAVARCCLQRALASFSLRNNCLNRAIVTEFGKSRQHDPISNRQYSTFKASPFIETLNGLPDFDICKNPPEWKYVERLLPRKVVPTPAPKEEYPSGWQPQDPESAHLPFFISRTKNHMLPVYVKYTFRGSRQITMIRRIKGDIWTLGIELKTFLQKKYDKIIAIRVHEVCGQIEVKGDYAIEVEKFLLSKGF